MEVLVQYSLKSLQKEIPAAFADKSSSKSPWDFINTEYAWRFSSVPLKIFLFLHYFVPSAWTTAYIVIPMPVVVQLVDCQAWNFALENSVFIQIFNGNMK